MGASRNSGGDPLKPGDIEAIEASYPPPAVAKLRRVGAGQLFQELRS